MNTNPNYGNSANTYTGALPATQAGAYPVGTTAAGTNAGQMDPSHPPSALKGNMTSMMGKMTHNPTKEQNGNIMIANAAEQKAAKFETKALQWESKGNTSKAQKNREKVCIRTISHYRTITNVSITGYPLPPEGCRQVGSAPHFRPDCQTHWLCWTDWRFPRPQERQGSTLRGKGSRV
jgi:hypothetical protein